MKTYEQLQKEEAERELQRSKWRAAWKAAERVAKLDYEEEAPLIFARFLSNPHLTHEWSIENLDRPEIYGMLLLLHKATALISCENFAMEVGAHLLAKVILELQPLIARQKRFENPL